MPTAAAPCPGWHGMTQLGDPATPSSRHRDVPTMLTLLLGSDRTPVPKKQWGGKWVVTRTQEKHTHPHPPSTSINHDFHL